MALAFDFFHLRKTAKIDNFVKSQSQRHRPALSNTLKKDVSIYHRPNCIESVTSRREIKLHTILIYFRINALCDGIH